MRTFIDLYMHTSLYLYESLQLMSSSQANVASVISGNRHAGLQGSRGVRKFHDPVKAKTSRFVTMGRGANWTNHE